ncbi:MAG: dTDP-4-dehydrorhamnose reductase [Candidatus Magnetoglobus multicellularis str. Araruama]|uniref:dTDP-4-dehydrorhamnose reductase n=1 Tax=Candidatus Magnetoglobus multicellularis str. Araruama TaxID=890399 RepID=A0A1V1P2E7_9BACT|nr:MAG: dTDP-4-dehydrorhamnose reductase [Candidatus Magnetoglobus multicellularis str. Araruama]
MKSKIVITGATGQLGTDCMQVLSMHHDTIGFSHEQLDISNARKVHQISTDIHPDFIINCAAFTRVDDCETMTDKAFEINARGPYNLARSAFQLGAKLIHISTDYVFDGKRQLPECYIESDPTHPVSVYGKSKLEGEMAVINETDQYMIIRTAWLFGKYGNNFLKTIYGLAISDKLPLLKVVNTQYGSFTHTMDLARQIYRLIAVNGQGIYHASGEGYCTWYDGAAYYLKAMGIKKEIKACTEEEFPTKAIRPTNSILCNQRLIDNNLLVIPNWQVAIDHFVARTKDVSSW